MKATLDVLDNFDSTVIIKIEKDRFPYFLWVFLNCRESKETKNAYLFTNYILGREVYFYINFEEYLYFEDKAPEKIVGQLLTSF